MIAGCVLEQGFLHPQRRLFSFLFATDSHSMQPDAAPQHHLYRQILAPLPFQNPSETLHTLISATFADSIQNWAGHIRLGRTFDSSPGDWAD